MPTLSITDYWRAFLISSLIGEFPDAASLTMADLEHRYYTNLCGLPYPPNLSISDLKYASSTSGIANAEDGLELLLGESLLFADARNYSGSGPLTNGGISGSVLNLQMGTTAGVDTNDPTWLPVDPDGAYVYIEPQSQNRLQEKTVTPALGDSSFLDIRIKFDLSVRLPLSNWCGVVGRWPANWSLSFFVDGFGTYQPGFFFWQAGARQDVNASAGMQLSNKWFRVTRDRTSGIVRFYTSIDGTAWALLGAEQPSTPGPMDPIPTGQVFLGNDPNNGFNFLGRIYEAHFYSGTTEVLSCYASQMGISGNDVWLLDRQASGRKSVLVQSRPCFLFGTDDKMTIPAASATGLNVNAGEAFTCISYWKRLGQTTYYATAFAKAATAPTPGWRGLFDINSRQVLGQMDIGGSTFYSSGWFPVSGAIEASGIMRDATGNNYVVTNTGTAGNVVPAGTGTMANNSNFDIGNLTIDMSQPVDGEFYGIAFFKRALTVQEIQQVNAYYGVV